LPFVEGSKFGNTATLITLLSYLPFMGLSLRRSYGKKEVELLFKTKYRGPVLMMLFFQNGIGRIFIGFLLNIFFSPFVRFCIGFSSYIYFLSQETSHTSNIIK
jgi:CPA2 family monovalent cation:H+ antiporter-2